MIHSSQGDCLTALVQNGYSIVRIATNEDGATVLVHKPHTEWRLVTPDGSMGARLNEQEAFDAMRTDIELRERFGSDPIVFATTYSARDRALHKIADDLGPVNGQPAIPV